ncbi:MAG: cell division protein FtsQ/DivIB [Planctomycetota bacterium]
MTALPPRRRPVAAEPPPAPPRSGLGAFMTDHQSGLAALAVAVAAMAAGWLLWRQYGERARADRGAILMPADVELVGCADWVTSDLKAQALRNASLDGGLPLDDPELARRLARAFDIHPWVREVVRVTLRHPAGAVVEIRCREPVAMVAVPGGLLAVDAEGIVLPPDDFNGESAALYPKLAGIASGPRGAAGFPWGDPAVEEGAAVAAVIGPEWRSLGLIELRPVGEAKSRSWDLVGAGDLVIHFGSAPGHEAPGEPTAAMKVARLRGLAAEGKPGGEVDLSTAPDRDAPAAVISAP